MMWEAWYWITDTIAGWSPWLLRRELRYRGYQRIIADSALSGIRITAGAALDHLDDEDYRNARIELKAVLGDVAWYFEEMVD